MNRTAATKATRPRTAGTRTPAAARSRWPVLFSALFLLWCAGWYCREDSQGLLYLSTALATLAAIRSRPLPNTPRWIIWSGIVLAIFCLAANVSRLMPPDNAPEESRVLDRIITLAFAMGMTSLFFRPSVHTITIAAIGGLPMSMLVLSRARMTLGSVEGYETPFVWSMVALMMAADLAQRLTVPRTVESLTPGMRELARRLLLLLFVASLSFLLRQPVERAAKAFQVRVFGWVMSAQRQSRHRHTDLTLTARIPRSFVRRMRMIMLVDAQHLPGYLRETVFVRYQNGRWSAIKPEEPLPKASHLSSGYQKNMFILNLCPPKTSLTTWRVELLAPALLSGFCLPGHAVTLSCEGQTLSTEPNGMVTPAGAFPEQYRIEITPSRLLHSAYPQPDGFGVPDYLQIPDDLTASVSNWVESCSGLATARTIFASIKHIEDHFATNFTYRLGLRMRSTPDPLIDFMARKEGACTLFASAAALMFRNRGIPARVIGGYVCSEWNPWLKRWVVREREGHAWVEVFDGHSGSWLVADPTPPGGNPAVLEKAGTGRWLLDLLNASWKRFLAFLRNANFLVVLADFGETLFLFLWQVLVSFPGAVVLIGFSVVWWIRLRRRQTLNTEARLYREMTRAMQRIARRAVAPHLLRRISEPWSIWLQRVEPELTAKSSEALRTWLTSYQELRYRVKLDIPSANAWLARAREKR